MRDLLGGMPVQGKGAKVAGRVLRSHYRSDACERREGRKGWLGEATDHSAGSEKLSAVLMGCQ